MHASIFSGCRNAIALQGGMGYSLICLRSPDPTHPHKFMTKYPTYFSGINFKTQTILANDLKSSM
jgi:hypothetical protein